MKEQAHERIVNKFNQLIDIFTNERPNTVFEMNRAWSATYLTYIKAYFGVIYLYFLRIEDSRKYFFQTFRNKEVIDCLNQEEIVILGNRQHLAACRASNFKLIWVGGIVAAIVIATRGGHTLPLRLQLYLAKKSMGKPRKYFFLYEDTTPVGIFFAIFANEHSHISICIQHGTPMIKELWLDGLLCRYNLLYQLSMKEDMNPESNYFELGPPFDIIKGEDVSFMIILVGTGYSVVKPSFYRRSLDCYQRIANQLNNSVWKVIYRPHPCERGFDYSSHFSNVDKSSKVTCLSGARKLFIGYQSSLLFEAKTFGHSAITLIDPDTYMIKSFTPNAELDASCVENIEGVIVRLHSEMKKCPARAIPPLKERFMPILRKIESDTHRV